jgi:putative inorganic carbon (hco3(-)) transporter
MRRDRLLLPWAAAGAAGLLAAIAAVAAARSGDAAMAYLLAIGVLALPAGVVLAGAVSPAETICAGLALSVFSGQFGQLGVPIGVDRVLIVTGIAAALVRELRAEQPRVRVTWLHICLALLLAYAGLNAVYAGTLTGDEPFFGLLDYLGVIPFALFLLAPAAFPGPQERVLLLGTLVGVGLYLGITAVLETTGPSALVLPGYIADPSVGIHYGRARGPFVEAAGNGLALFICGVACAVALVQWRRHRWVAALGLVVCAIGIEFTLTRQVWLAAAAATVVAMLVNPILRRWLVPAAVLGATVVAAALLAVPGFTGKAETRFESQRPVWDRLNSNDAALRMIGEKPLAGFGWYRFGDASRDHYRLAADRALTVVGRAHNVFLGYAAELGVLAALVWVACLAAAIGRALRRRGPPDLDVWRAGLVAVAVAWLIVANFTPMGYAFVHSALWLWTGLCWSRT